MKRGEAMFAQISHSRCRFPLRKCSEAALQARTQNAFAFFGCL
jgi:hypothetical protein